MADNADRWANISSKFDAVIKRGGDDRLFNYRLAAHLRAELAASCGCPESSVYYYKFTHGHVPENDQYERVDSASESVVSTETGRTLGLGIELQVSPGSLPKVVIVWSVDIERDENDITITSPMINSPISFSMDKGEKFNAKIKVAAEEMYQSLCDALDVWIAGGHPPKRIGFGSLT